MGHYIKGLVLGILLAGLFAGYHYYQTLPSSYKFWIPLDINVAPGPFTKYKVSALKNDYPACKIALGNSGFEFEAVADKTSGTCPLTDQVLLHQSHYPYSQTVKATCPVIAALLIWEQHVVKPAAERHLSSPVASISHYGIFSCRNIAGSSRRSQHASANAIDISGFTLENGQSISVLNDWDDMSEQGQFLREIRDGACGIFSTVLGPDYNNAHRDHFHLDMGSFSICR